MDASSFDTQGPATLGQAYSRLRLTNEELRKIEADLYLTSCVWTMYHRSPNSSDQPEYWINTTNQDPWANDDKIDAWRLNAMNKGLFDSDLAVVNELKTLGGLKKQLEDIQLSLRTVINELSRPSLSSWHILDMPDEILSLIFELVEGFQPDFPSVWYLASKDIKNCRLTCQRFYCLSSRFFLRSVSVDLSLSSLSRFEEISCHPIISKGIRSVRALLHFYDSKLSDSISEFALHNSVLLNERAESMEWMKPWTYSKYSEEACQTIIKTLRDIAASWRRIASDTPAQSPIEEGHDRTNSPLLRTTHQRYQQLYVEQEELSASGSFSPRVAAGITRMPCARVLALLDRDDPLPKGLPFFTCEDINALIYDSTLQPMNYYTAYSYGFTPRIFDIIPKLPVAVQHLGAWLENIDIRLSYVESPSHLLPSSEIRQQLPLAVQRLRRFSLECRHWLNEEADEDILKDIFTPFLSTSSLQEIRIDMLRDGESDDEDVLDVSGLIASQQWPSLSYLFLRDVALHPLECQNFAGVASGCWYSLEHVRLLSGTWAEVLDTIRQKSVRKFQLCDPLGAECDDMPPEELSSIFGKGTDPFSRSQAERYVERIEHQNPLRDQPEQDSASEV